MTILKAGKTLQAAVQALTIPIPITPAEALQAATTPAALTIPKEIHPKAVVLEIIIKEMLPATAALIAVIRAILVTRAKTAASIHPKISPQMRMMARTIPHLNQKHFMTLKYLTRAKLIWTKLMEP